MSRGFCSKFHALSNTAKIKKVGQDLTDLQTTVSLNVMLGGSNGVTAIFVT